MFSNPAYWFLSVYGVVYLTLLFFTIRHRKRCEGKFPLGDDVRLMRQPGEALVRRLTELDGKLMEGMCWAAGVPIILAGIPLLVGGWIRESWSLGWLIAALALFVAGISWGLQRLGRIFAEYRCVRLGLYGERAVADQLEELKRTGFWVFHDVPCLGGGGPFNLDHVVVGGGAVAVIETKTRRKHTPEGGGPAHKVSYDGDRLVWPRGSDSESVTQVIDGAEWLQKRLKQELAVEVLVFPVLAIPGWFVESKSRGPVIVSNEKPLPGAIRHQCRGSLATEQEDLIARHLALMCRDVDFPSIR